MRIAHPSTGESQSPPCTMAAVGNKDVIYQALLRRCQNLEESHASLSATLRDLQQQQHQQQRFSTNDIDDDDDEEEEYDNGEDDASFLRRLPLRRPYESLLNSLGHAVHVFRASSGEIMFWNRAAENLYGWRDYEVVGRKSFTELLVPQDHYIPLQKIMARLLRTGEPWSGRFPFKKRSGKVLSALVTKSLLYENGGVAGIIVVSSDASMVNIIELNNQGWSYDSQCHERGFNIRKIKWHPRSPTSSVAPEIASSVSNLAAKVLSKLQIKGGGNNEDDGSSRKGGKNCDNSPVTSEPSSAGDTDCKREKTPKSSNCSNNGSRGHFGEFGLETPPLFDDEDRKTNERSSQNLGSHGNVKETEGDSHGSIGSSGTNPSEGDTNESKPMVDCEIQWADLHMGEEIGQGFYAIVYRGLWNGSDVAIKVFLKNEYSEGTLTDYKKEIDIMKKLRHPNVLLFMGAAYSQERLAIITEFLPRGSLFKTLHKNSQVLDIKRRLRMALDVARGMNYLHRRNPPIVHRDLKSSNLLVDKNWTVKVGDFGLSKLKNATFLTAKSGRGTPQWMAPEILRNEPSNEKSDVYSFGVILWELMTESIPWNNLNPLQVVGIVGFMDRRLELPEKIEPRVASIIRDCWKSDPAQRPSFEDIIRSMSNLQRLAPASTKSSEL